jgi:hypothetical protein
MGSSLLSEVVLVKSFALSPYSQKAANSSHLVLIGKKALSMLNADTVFTIIAIVIPLV